MWRRLIYHPEINYALRQTLVLCLPVLFGLLIGQLQLGLMFFPRARLLQYRRAGYAA